MKIKMFHFGAIFLFPKPVGTLFGQKAPEGTRNWPRENARRPVVWTARVFGPSMRVERPFGPRLALQIVLFDKERPFGPRSFPQLNCSAPQLAGRPPAVLSFGPRAVSRILLTSYRSLLAPLRGARRSLLNDVLIMYRSSLVARRPHWGSPRSSGLAWET